MTKIHMNMGYCLSNMYLILAQMKDVHVILFTQVTLRMWSTYQTDASFPMNICVKVWTNPRTSIDEIKNT